MSLFDFFSQEEVIKIINKTQDEIKIQKIFEKAIKKNYLELVKYLLQDKRVNPNDGIMIAFTKDYQEIVELLLKDERMDTNINKEILQEIFEQAIKKNNVELVKLLLQKVDPHNELLILALKNDYQ